MEKSCYSCPQWNDWKGKCDAPYWCPDKERANQDYYVGEYDEEEE